MDEKNGSNVLLGIKCLRKLSKASPHAIYWGYIGTRTKQLGLRTQQPEEIAIGRMACLNRSSISDRVTIQDAWGMLSHSDRLTLTNHFLADGIIETAFLFTFLPLYFANS